MLMKLAVPSLVVGCLVVAGSVAHVVFANVSQGTQATENVSITITASFDPPKEH